MSRLILSLALVGLLGVVHAQVPEGLRFSGAPPRDDLVRTGTATIRGRVMSLETGKPIR